MLKSKYRNGQKPLENLVAFIVEKFGGNKIESRKIY